MGNKQQKSEMLSVLIEGTSTGEFSPVYRHPTAHSTMLLPKIWGHSCFFELFQNICEKHYSRNWLGHKQGSEFSWCTYAQCNKYIHQVMHAFSILSIRNEPARWDLIGLMSGQREEWIIIDLACMGLGIPTVGFLDTESDSLLLSKINELQLKLLCVDIKGYMKIINIAGQEGFTVKSLILFDEIPSESEENAQNLGIQLLKFKEFLTLPALKIQKKIEPKDLCMFSYTEGTESLPKFVRITNEDLMSSFAAVLYENFNITNKDVYILYSNLALYGQRILTYVVTLYGVSVGITEDLSEDLSIIKPTLMLAVPRILDFIQNSITYELSTKSALSSKLFKNCYKSCEKHFLQTNKPKSSVWSNIVFGSIREKFGKRLKIILTSGAPPNPSSLLFVQICLGCKILEAYGQTETGYSNLYGSVGLGPLSVCELRLLYKPDILFEGLDNKKFGELYINNSYSPGGWKPTGDLFKITDETNGFVFIERIVYVIQVKCGYFVAPQRLENIYRESLAVEQIVVYGCSRINGVVAVIVIDKEYFCRKWTNAVEVEEIRQSEVAVEDILRSFLEISRQNNLRSYEKILDVHIETEPWVSVDLITSSLKIKRLEVIKKYQREINAMIEKLSIRY